MCLNIQEIACKNVLFLFSLIKPSEAKEKAIGKVDDLLELYMGIRDTDLGKIILFKKVLCVLILWNWMLIYVLLAFIVNYTFQGKKCLWSDQKHNENEDNI